MTPTEHCHRQLALRSVITVLCLPLVCALLSVTLSRGRQTGRETLWSESIHHIPKPTSLQIDWKDRTIDQSNDSSPEGVSDLKEDGGMEGDKEITIPFEGKDGQMIELLSEKHVRLREAEDGDLVVREQREQELRQIGRIRTRVVETNEERQVHPQVKILEICLAKIRQRSKEKVKLILITGKRKKKSHSRSPREEMQRMRHLTRLRIKDMTSGSETNGMKGIELYLFDDSLQRLGRLWHQLKECYKNLFHQIEATDDEGRLNELCQTLGMGFGTEIIDFVKEQSGVVDFVTEEVEVETFHDLELIRVERNTGAILALYL
jgi:hypothetical protein